MSIKHSILASLAAFGLWTALAQDAATTPQAPPTPPPQPSPAREIVVSGETPAPAPATNGPASLRNIRFQFDGIPYADVLERFAQMAGKPLLSDTNITGSLSYNDPNPYTFPEAIETLNLILSMRGVMLLDTGNQLRLVPFKDLRSLPLPLLRGTDPTGDVRPGDVISVVLDLDGLDAREVAESVTPMLSNAGSVAPLGRGRRLVITDRLSNIQRVRALLATIDSQESTERQMRTYTLLNASGAIIADLLNRTFGVATAPKRTAFNPNTKNMDVLPPDPKDYITAVYDEASRTLVLFGPDERLTLAEQLINRFEQKDGPAGDVRIYFPQTLKADELANIIRQAIPAVAAPNETAATAATKARVISDNPQNRLIVAAPIPGQLEQIEQLISRVDKGAITAGSAFNNNGNVPNRSTSVQLTRIFRPRSADATNVASILTQALTRKAPNGQPSTSASISVDGSSQSVVVSGTANDVQIASDIVSQLETGTTQPTALQTRFIDVGSPDEARRLQPLVEQLYRNQTVAGSSSSVAHAKIIPDTESGRLIVTATEEHLARIESLVTQLRAERAEPQPRKLKVFSLVHSRTTAALPAIQNLLDERLSDRRFNSIPKPALVPDPANNRLLVTATDEQLLEIEQIIAVIDAAPEQPRRDLTIIPLSSKPASEVIPLVSQLLSQLRSPNSEPPSLIADPSGKQILVLANTNDLQQVRTLVAQFDTSPASSAPRQFKAVELGSRTAAELAPLVQQLYSEQIKGLPEPAGGPASVIPETKLNRLMVSGSEKEIARVEAIIRQIDPSERSSAREETRVFRLRSASAADLASLIEKSVNAQGQSVRVLLDARSNSLVVSGERSAIDNAAQIIQQLDTRNDSGPREFKVLDVKSSDASSLAPTLNTLFTDLLRDQHGPEFVSSTRITADLTGNRILVTGPREEIEQVASLLDRLDNAPQQAPGARVFKLSQADATLMAPIVSSAMLRYDNRGQPIRRVTVTADEKSNSLVVSGNRSDLQDAESVIEKLDGDSGGVSRERILRIFPVKSPPEALATLVNQVFTAQNPRSPASVSITPEPASKRLIVLAPATLMTQVEELVTSLDNQPDQADRLLHPVELQNVTASEILPRVQQIYAEQSVGKTLKPASLYPDPSGSRLLVQGTPEQAAAISQIVSTLAAPPRTQRETRTIEVGSTSDAQRLVPLVQQLYRDQWKGRSESDPADAQIVADPRSGRIIVTGKPEHLKEIESIVQQLGTSKASSSSRETRILDLTSASAVELATTVRTLYTEQAKSRFGSIPPDTLITPDSGANRLIIVGDTNELAEIEDIVRKLDRVSSQSSSARVFKIKSAEPDKVAEILTASLVRYDAYGRAQRRATVSVDAKTRTLIVTGDPKELQGVSSIIDQLDQSLGEQPQRRMKVVTLTQGRAATLSPKVRQLFNDRVKSQPELGTAEVLIIEDTESNQLILAGSDQQITVVDQIIADLQSAQTARAARETRLIDFNSADELARLQPLVTQLYQDRSRNNPSDPADAVFVPDPRNARLIVTARSNHLAEIESILAQLRGSNASPEPRGTAVIDLTTANAVELATTVRTLYTEQARTRPGAPAADTLILPDGGANRLIVTGATNEIAIVEDIIRKLDRISAQSASTRVVKLKSADPNKVAEILSSALVRYDAFGRAQRRVSVSVDAKTRTLITTGDPKELQAATVIIEQLDQSLGTQADRSMRVVPLRQRRATEVTAKVREVFLDQARSNPELGTTDPLILDDAASNQLVLAGTDAQLDSLTSIIEALEKGADNATRTTRILSLENASASTIASLISQLYGRRAGSDPAERIAASVGANDHSLVIDAPNVAFDKIEELVKSLDQPEPGASSFVQSVRLTKGRADEIASAVSRVFTNRPGFNPANRVTITPVNGANSILLNGPTNAVQDVLRIVRELDAEGSSSDIEVRVYKLENGSAKEVSSILQQLLQTVSRRRFFRSEGGFDPEGGRGGGPPASVSIDDRSNSLIVTGTAAHFAVVDKILPTLDKVPDRADRDVQFVWLKKARAFDVSSQLESLFEDRPRRERPVIEADLSNNSITIIGRKADLAQIQDLVERLDEQGKDSSYQVRLRTLDRVAAEQMARLIENLYPQTTGSALSVVEKIPIPTPDSTNSVPGIAVAIDREANALVLAGPVTELDRVERLISDLSFNFYGNEAEFRLFPLKDADPVLVARTLSEVLKQDPIQLPQQPGQPPRVVQQQPKITVVAEPRTRSIVVRARPTDFNLLESLIKQLDTAGETAQIAFRIFPLQNASPEKALPLVQQMVAQLNATRPGDPVTVTISPRDRGLLVVARESVIAQILPMIETIDLPSRVTEAEVRIFALQRANAAQLASVLQSLLRPGSQGESTPEARELQDQIRRLNIRTASGDPVSLDLDEPIRISPDPAGGATGGNRLLITSTAENLEALASVIEFLDSPAMVEGVRVRFVRLAHADAASVTQTLTTIFAQGRSLAAGPAGPNAVPDSDQGKALVHPLNIATDPRSNTLILAGRAETIDLALKVVADIDQPLEHFVTDVRLFRLKHASAIRLVPLLQSVFTEGPNVPGTEGLATQITRLRTLREGGDPSRTNDIAKGRAALTLQADDLSNILIVAARSDMLPLVEDVITQLDIPAASGLETVRVYPLQFADPASIQKILADLFNGQRAPNLRNEDRPVITVDARSSSLIVAGNSKSFGVLEGLLKQLDQKLPFDLREIRLLPLAHADASVVAATLQRVMDARVTQRAALNAGAADALKTIIIADTRSNALLVGGSREAFDLVESLAKQLDEASPALSGRIRIIPVVHADARVLATTISALFDQRYAASPATDIKRLKPIILPDTRANALLVAASQDDNQTLDDLLSKLDAKLDNAALSLTVLPLKHNDAGRVAPLISTIFAARLRAQTLPGQPPLPSQQIDVQPDPLNNALIISASKENLTLIQELVATIDAEPSIPGGVFEMFTLEFADAQRVATLLRSLVDQGLYRPGFPSGGGGGGGGPRGRNAPNNVLSISVDPRSNTLIVSASPENLSLVKSVIEKVDNKDLAANADVRLFPLKHARASSIATTLQQFFAAKRTADSVAVNANERQLPVAVIADDRINSILVTGGKEAFDLVDRLLPQLDGDGTFSRLNFRVFPLRKATATKLQVTLQSILANRPPKVRGEPIDPITIVADSWVNALLVGATVDDLETVSSLIDQLDSDATDTGIAIHVFPLAKADARRVATTIQQLFRENTPNQVLPITVNADDRINAIVVSCGETDARRIGELVRQLDTDQVARVSEIRVFPLIHARAETLSAILTSALNSRPAALTEQNPNAQSVLQFISRTDDGQELITAALKEGILITPDLRMNSLIVSGPVEYMGLLGQIINRLDASSPQQAKIRVFSLQNADARQMADLLTQLFRMTQAPASANQRSVQYTLVRPRLDPNGLPLGDDESLASATVGSAEQNALTVTVDPRTNSLLVGGSEHYVALVSEIIGSLDSSEAAERTTEVVRLRNSQAIEVATAIRNFLDQERNRIVQVLGADAVGTGQRLLEREVAVVAEEASNTLLVSANRRYFDQVRELINELDQAQPQVLIQVLLAEVTLDSVGELGIEWGHSGSRGDVSYGTGTDFGVANQLQTLGGYSAAVSGTDFNFLLRALKTDGRLEVLSRPQIVTADNKPATINIGQRIPLITDSRVTPQGDTINSFRYEDVGVNLTVTPKISPDGFVKMELGTTNSAISSSTVEINRSATVPIINQRRANTTVSVQSGQTIIIGGLISTTDDKRVKKMPILGDIPYVGALFRSTKSTRERRELLIFLTPVVMSNNQDPVPLSDPYKVTQEVIRNSRVRKELKPDEYQRPILEPIWPEDAPTNSPAPARRVRTPRS